MWQGWWGWGTAGARQPLFQIAGEALGAARVLRGEGGAGQRSPSLLRGAAADGPSQLAGEGSRGLVGPALSCGRPRQSE